MTTKQTNRRSDRYKQVNKRFNLKDVYILLGFMLALNVVFGAFVYFVTPETYKPLILSAGKSSEETKIEIKGVEFPTDDWFEETRQQLSSIVINKTVSFEKPRWPTNKATVYIDVPAESGYYQVFRDAIYNWNATGAFELTVIDNKSQADIVLMVVHFPEGYSDEAAGLATNTFDKPSNVLTKSIVELNLNYLENPAYGYTYEHKLNVASHELGHALGLEHDDENVSVMQSVGSTYGIQQVDIDNLVALYAE